MRTPLLAGLLIALLPACLSNGITGIGGDDGTGDDGTGDDSGDDMGSDDTGDTTPRMTATLDKTTLVTENGKTETITVNLASTNGWAGDVALTKSLVDAANNAIPGITIEGPETVAVAADQTATAMYTIKIPTNATGSVIEGSVKVSATFTGGSTDLSSALTLNNFYTVDYPAGTGTNASTHPLAGQTVTLKRGTIIKWPNEDTGVTHIIHGGGSFSGEHEDQTNGGTAGRTYEIPTIGYAPGTSGPLGCHTHGTASYATFTLQ